MPLDLTQANLFDLVFKLLFRRHPEALLRLAQVNARPGTVVTVKTGVIVKELSADDVFAYETSIGREAICVEYQIDPDRRLVRRWIIKALTIEEELGIPVILLVIYLRRSDNATFPEDYAVGTGPLSNYHRFAVIRLWEQVDRIRNGELPELTPLLPLAEDCPPEQAVRESREIIQRLPLEAEAKAELLGVCYLIGLKYVLTGVLNAIFREELPMLKEAGIIGEWIEESLLKGREEGKVLGGVDRARHTAILMVERRFGSVPDPLRNQIENASADWCEALTLNAAEVESLTELRLP